MVTNEWEKFTAHMNVFNIFLTISFIYYKMVCSTCKQSHSSHEGFRDITYDFYQCHSCNQLLFDCPICKKFVIYNQRRSYDMHIKSNNHISGLQNNSTDVNELNHFLNTEDVGFSNPDFVIGNICNEVSSSTNNPDELSDLQFNSTAVKRFFMNESKYLGRGVRNLISNAICNKVTSGRNVVSKKISKLHWAVMSLCLNLKRTKRMLLLNVFKQLAVCFPKSVGTRSLLPLLEKDMRRMYLDGKCSIRNNLPIPNFHDLDKMTFVHFGDILTDFFTLSKVDMIQFDPVVIKQKLIDMNSVHLIDLMNKYHNIDHGVYYLLLSMWSDGFDCNAVKQNMGSVWAYTITLQLGNLTKTYPIVIGTSKCDHNKVHQRVNEDLKIWVDKIKTVITQSLGEVIDIIILPYSARMDIPEKRDQLFLKKGNGYCCERTLFSFDAKGQVHALSSCNKCFDKNISTLKKIQNSIILTDSDVENNCQSCCDWNYLSPNAHFVVRNEDYIALDYFIKMGYDVVDNNGKYMHSNCIKLDFRILKDIVTNVSLAYFRHSISQGTFLCLLERCQINGDHATYIYNQCIQLQNLIDFDTDLITTVWLEKQFKFPSLWEGVFSVNAYHELPMHLLFLNVYKNFQKQMKSFYRAKLRLTQFGEVVKNKLKHVKDLRLEWCKIEEYHPNGNYGCYISQTFLAHARVGRWFHAHMMELKNFVSTEKYHFTNNTSIKKQKGPALQKWLGSRNISLKSMGKKLTVPQMRNVVSRLYNSTEEDINLYRNTTSKLPSFQKMETAMLSMHSLIARYMSPEYASHDEKYNEALLQVKIFLTIMKDIDIRIDKKDNAENIVTRSYSFQCLLNLPNDEKLMGKMRNVWEGGDAGEGQIKHIKKFVHQGLHKKFALHAIKNCYEREFMNKYALEQSNVSTGNKFFNFHMHKSDINFIHQLNEKKPISLITIMIEAKVVFAVVLKKSLKRRTDSATKYDIIVIQLDHNELDEHVFIGQFYYFI